MSGNGGSGCPKVWRVGCQAFNRCAGGCVQGRSNSTRAWLGEGSGGNENVAAAEAKPGNHAGERGGKDHDLNTPELTHALSRVALR